MKTARQAKRQFGKPAEDLLGEAELFRRSLILLHAQIKLALDAIGILKGFDLLLETANAGLAVLNDALVFRFNFRIKLRLFSVGGYLFVGLIALQLQLLQLGLKRFNASAAGEKALRHARALIDLVLEDGD